MENRMAKAYWVVCYRSIKNPDALAAYAKLAAPARVLCWSVMLGRTSATL